MAIIKPDEYTQAMESVQFLKYCWIAGLSYQDYVNSAHLCNQYAYGQSMYKVMCDKFEEQLIGYNL